MYEHCIILELRCNEHSLIISNANNGNSTALCKYLPMQIMTNLIFQGGYSSRPDISPCIFSDLIQTRLKHNFHTYLISIVLILQDVHLKN